MQLASCLVCLTIYNQVPKPSVTPAEVAILRIMHVQNLGDNPVPNDLIKISKREYNPSPINEVMRLMAKYGNNPATKKPWLEELYPGVRTNPSILPQKFSEVKWLPANVTANGQAPSRIMLPGEPGYEEPTDANGKPTKWEPPVASDLEPAEPEAATDADLETVV